jgi:signal peptidase I
MASLRRRPAWRDSLESVVFAVVVALTLRAFVFEAFKIPSGSMIPTLEIGDQIWVNKFIFGLRIPFTTIRLVKWATPKRGDVIVFVCPEPPNEDYIKRVVGLPGDQVQVVDGVLHINGERMPQRALGPASFTDRDGAGWHPLQMNRFEETLGDHTFTTLQDPRAYGGGSRYSQPFTVPSEHVFVMGDNRDHSHDSRVWGAVPLRHIIGRSTFIWWSWGEHGLNARRLGHWVP